MSGGSNWVPTDELVQDAYKKVHTEMLEDDSYPYLDEGAISQLTWAVFRAVYQAVQRDELVPRSCLQEIGWQCSSTGDINTEKTCPEHESCLLLPVYTLAEPEVVYQGPTRQYWDAPLAGEPEGTVTDE